jgi:hypothetical protein
VVYLGIIGESVAAIMLIIGVTLQIQNGGDIAHLCVSIGAGIFAIFTKIRLVGYEWDEVINKHRKKKR